MLYSKQRGSWQGPERAYKNTPCNCKMAVCTRSKGDKRWPTLCVHLFIGFELLKGSSWWWMWCHHTSCTTYRKFGMMLMMSWTGQHLLFTKPIGSVQPATINTTGLHGLFPRLVTLTTSTLGASWCIKVMGNFYHYIHTTIMHKFNIFLFLQLGIDPIKCNIKMNISLVALIFQYYMMFHCID